MIKANELRIGNFVTLNEKQRKELWENQINAQNDFFEVKTIYSDNDISIELDDEIIDISENDVDPIPLNEEWLLKFGFSNIQYNKEIDCNIYSGWDFGSISIQYPRGIEAHIFLGNYPVAIKYVHQLQNLYFALTGAELTVA